jgi:lysophospholipase L1-like esterase
MDQFHPNAVEQDFMKQHSIRFARDSKRLRRIAVAAGAILVCASPALAAEWVPVWTASSTPDLRDGAGGVSRGFKDESVRQDIRLAGSANALRLRISNELGTAPLKLETMTVRRVGADGPAVPVLFDGAASLTLPPGGIAISDEVKLAAPALADVAVSAYFPEAVAPAVRRTAVRIAPGRAEVTDTASLSSRQNVISAIYGQMDKAPKVVVALGDSITEGSTATLGSNRDWPSVLGQRLNAACPGRYVVVNAGISGNRLLDHGRSPSALARLDRDVLSLPKVDYVVLLEGINDIRHGGAPDFKPGRGAQEAIMAYRQIVTRLTDHRVTVIGATLTPFEGSDRFEPIAEATRQTMNAFIRKSGLFAGVVDFDAALRDPQKPLSMLEAASRPDRLHPSDEGYERMARSVDLSLFGCHARERR